MSGAAGGAMSSLQGMIPNAGSIASAFLQGSISRAAKKSISRMVGAGFVSVAVGNYATKVQAAYVETVGAAKLTLAGGGISQSSGPLQVTTVGGAILRTSGKAMSMSSKVSTTTVGAAAAFKSSEKLLIEGAKIRIQAGAALSLSAGGASIDMTPGSVAWKGDVKIEADTVKLKGATLNVTRG